MSLEKLLLSDNVLSTQEYESLLESYSRHNLLAEEAETKDNLIEKIKIIISDHLLEKDELQHYLARKAIELSKLSMMVDRVK